VTVIIAAGPSTTVPTATTLAPVPAGSTIVIQPPAPAKPAHLEWWQGFPALAIGAVLALLGGILTERFRRKGAQRDAVRQRGVDAAKEIVALLPELVDDFSHRYLDDTEHFESTTRRHLIDLDRLTLSLDDSTVRTRLEHASESLRHVAVLLQWEGIRPPQVVYEANEVARRTLGAFIRGEDPAETDGGRLDGWHKQIVEHYRILDESAAAERAKRAAGTGGQPGRPES
jgi:hypothetical protein